MISRLAFFIGFTGKYTIRKIRQTTKIVISQVHVFQSEPTYFRRGIVCKIRNGHLFHILINIDCQCLTPPFIRQISFFSDKRI